MLQQTQVARVEPVYRRFLRAFPSLRALASASRADVVRAWSGLGYNRRAVNLHACAIIVARDHGGRIPSDVAGLRALPGIGPYTASAVASIAFGAPVSAVDTNVRRVLSRAIFGADGHEISGAELTDVAQRILDPKDPGTWNQALMDLGREVCRPLPRCVACPLAGLCAFVATGRTPSRPGRSAPRFEGSRRQARGRVVRALVEAGPQTLAGLRRTTGLAGPRVEAAVASLVEDGIIGRSGGRVRLAEDRR